MKAYFVPNDVLAEIMESTRILAIAGFTDQETQTVRLWLSDGSTFNFPFSHFEISGDGTIPDFNDFSIIDHGNTIKFGNYEAAMDALVEKNYLPELVKKLK